MSLDVMTNDEYHARHGETVKQGEYTVFSEKSVQAIFRDVLYAAVHTRPAVFSHASQVLQVSEYYCQVIFEDIQTQPALDEEDLAYIGLCLQACTKMFGIMNSCHLILDDSG